MTTIESVTPVETARVRGGVAREALRYFVASLAALALDSALLWVGATQLGIAWWLAGAIAYGAGLLLVYVLSIRWVFTTRTVRDRRREFIGFAALGLVGLVLNSVTLSIASALGFALPVAKALSAGIGFVANFATRKLLLFTRVDTPSV